VRRLFRGRDARRLRTAVTNLRDYVDGQSTYLVDYARRKRAGQPVGTSTSEGLANALVNRRVNKLQQMRWSATGAHAVVTVRANAMNKTYLPISGAVAGSSLTPAFQAVPGKSCASTSYQRCLIRTDEPIVVVRET